MAKGDGIKVFNDFRATYGDKSVVNVGQNAIESALQISKTAPQTSANFAEFTDDTENIIHIYGYIGDVGGYIEGVSVSDITRALDRMSGTPKVVISSAGGILDDGITIYNLLKDRNAETYILGMAGSAASVIALAGETGGGGTYFMEGSAFFIHNAWGITVGDDVIHKSRAEQLAKDNIRMKDIYAAVSGLDEATLTKYMDDETQFTADEAVSLGFGKHYETDKSKAVKDPTPLPTPIDKKDFNVSSLKLALAGNLAKQLLKANGGSHGIG